MLFIPLIIHSFGKWFIIESLKRLARKKYLFFKKKCWIHIYSKKVDE